MPGASSFGAAPDGAQGKERRLESWGEIAAYLRREIRTVQRWEKTLALPVHRLLVGKQSSVYAYPSELDKWYREREPKEIKDDDAGDEPSPSLVVVEPNVPAIPTIPLAPPAPISGVKPPSQIPYYEQKWFAGMAILVIAAVLGVIFWPPPSMPPGTGAAPDAKIRLFVRPFQNIAGDPSQAEFTEGLTNELNTRLGRLDPKRLGVIAPTSSKQLGGKSIAELEPLLKLNYVLEGSAVCAAQTIRCALTCR